MSPLNTRAAGLPRIFGRSEVGDRALERLVVHRERPVLHHAANPQARGPLGVHDEGLHRRPASAVGAMSGTS